MKLKHQIPAIFFSIICIILSSTFLKAQTFTIDKLDQRIVSPIIPPSGFEFGISSRFENLTNSPLNLSFKVIEEVLPTHWDLTDCSLQFFTQNLPICDSSVVEGNLDPLQETFHLISVIFDFVEKKTDSLSLTVLVWDQADSLNSNFTYTYKWVVNFPDEGDPTFNILEREVLEYEYDVENDDEVVLLLNSPVFKNSTEDIKIKWLKIEENIPPNWNIEGTLTTGSNPPLSFDFPFNDPDEFEISALENFDILSLRYEISNITENGVFSQKFLFYDSVDSLNSHQIVSFKLIACKTQSFREGMISVLSPQPVCTGDEVEVIVSDDFSDIMWSNGDTSRAIQIPAGTSLYVAGIDSLTCPVFQWDPTEIFPLKREKMCLVSVSESGADNILYWEKTPDFSTEKYIIEKELNSGFEPIAEVLFDTPGTFTDVDGAIDRQEKRYRIVTENICGAQGVAHRDSSTATTIDLNALFGSPSPTSSFLFWERYEGKPVRSYTIFKGNSPQSLQQIDEVSSSFSTPFEDPTPLSGTTYYRLRANFDDGCNIDASGNEIKESWSTIAAFSFSSTKNTINQNEILISPNPAFDEFRITSKNPIIKPEYIEVYNALGMLILETRVENNTTINCSTWSNGSYFLKLSDGDKNQIWKTIQVAK